MSNNENNYSDYFKSLEKRISAEKSSAPKTYTPRKNTKKKRSLYRVIRLRPAFIFCFAAAVIMTVSALVIHHKNKTKAQTLPQDSGKSGVLRSVSDKKDEKKISYSFNAESAAIPDTNDAAGAIIVNLDNHCVVASREAHTRLYPASTTKILTLLTAAENITDYEETFTMTRSITDPLYVAEATVAGFSDGEKVKMIDLLYGTILPSGADAAMGLAVKLTGSEEGLVKLMNEKVKALGLKDTHFTNVTGLYDEDHYTTAYDMAVILEAALENPICKKVLSTYQYTTAATEQHPDGILLSATLFNYMYGTEPETATIEGGKTGFVNESGYCIASYGSNNETGTRYIVITLKNSSRWPAFHGQIDLYKQFAK